MYISIEGWRGQGAISTSPVSRSVVLLGITSLLTDVSAEMVVAILPIFLIGTLGVSPIAFGVIDGLYQGASAIVRLASGYVADRWRAPKGVALFGYSLSMVARIPLILGAGLSGIAGALFVDRVGKGIRTAPRDAMIADASTSENLGKSFGVHRALDTAGALAGPIVAFGLLAWLTVDGANKLAAFNAIFVVSLLFAIAGVAVLGLLVAAPKSNTAAVAIKARDCVALLRRSDYRRLTIAAGVLGLVSVSDAFLYLTIAQHNDIADTWFPLMFVGTAVTYLVLAIPVGKLADRVGRVRVWLSGYALMLMAYVVALASLPRVATVIGCLILLGAAYSATDGVLSAAIAPLVNAEVMSSGMALVQTVIALAKFASSVMFGVAWTVWGPQFALAIFAALLAIALVGVTLMMRGTSQRDNAQVVSA